MERQFEENDVCRLDLVAQLKALKKKAVADCDLALDGAAALGIYTAVPVTHLQLIHDAVYYSASSAVRFLCSIYS